MEEINPNELEIREDQLRELERISNSLANIERTLEELSHSLIEALRGIQDRVESFQGPVG
jgi:hypothetical protein